ncbi:hypothetical protein JJD26997_0503 [Campylobacter jejuni subsp. doylei 269.97]|uniref:Uncharacterized protein n=1 Tax=Campylobacter jejuni subsp. doylei (strain ATCC BAA-1458 / RM4099 / 269.97) TaxID=360109 RepID=A7H2F4_CAMJD|nr:hypothetical protein JJD26997_0503 [Campylobacter jejuni subsp. doylei 269.97]
MIKNSAKSSLTSFLLIDLSDTTSTFAASSKAFYVVHQF